MNKLLVTPLIIVAAGGLLCIRSAVAQPTSQQPPPPAPRAASVQITVQPSLESAHDNTAIVRWTTNNPGGTDEHFGVVQYGTAPGALTQTAKSHIRLNRGHPDTMFRVRLDGLQPQTTYYYKVSSMGADGHNDNVQSDVARFTMPAPGQRVMNYPQP